MSRPLRGWKAYSQDVPVLETFLSPPTRENAFLVGTSFSCAICYEITWCLVTIKTLTSIYTSIASVYLIDRFRVFDEGLLRHHDGVCTLNDSSVSLFVHSHCAIYWFDYWSIILLCDSSLRYLFWYRSSEGDGWYRCWLKEKFFYYWGQSLLLASRNHTWMINSWSNHVTARCNLRNAAKGFHLLKNTSESLLSLWGPLSIYLNGW